MSLLMMFNLNLAVVYTPDNTTAKAECISSGTTECLSISHGVNQTANLFTKKLISVNMCKHCFQTVSKETKKQT
jgi:hypothetical protein